MPVTETWLPDARRHGDPLRDLLKTYSPIIGAGAPAGARRRSPTPRREAPTTRSGTASERPGEGPPPRFAPAATGPDRPGSLVEPERRITACRPVDRTAARRRTTARPDSPPRARPGDGADTASRGSRAWSARREPNDGCDGPGLDLV